MQLTLKILKLCSINTRSRATLVNLGSIATKGMITNMFKA